MSIYLKEEKCRIEKPGSELKIVFIFCGLGFFLKLFEKHHNWNDEANIRTSEHQID